MQLKALQYPAVWHAIVGFLVVHPSHTQAPVPGLAVFSKQFVDQKVILCTKGALLTTLLLRPCVMMPLHEWATGSLPPAGRPPTRQVGPSEVHVSTRRSMTSQIDIDCRHYGDRELGTARLVDINDHQESTERHRQWAVVWVRQTTETTQRLKRVLVS